MGKFLYRFGVCSFLQTRFGVCFVEAYLADWCNIMHITCLQMLETDATKMQINGKPLTYKPVREKINDLGSDPVLHKPA